MSVKRGKIYGYGKERGQCTALPKAFGFNIRGWAREWPKNAIALGYVVNRVPKPGAVLVTNENSYGTRSGHVALIEKVEDGWVYVIEQNYRRSTVTHGRLPLDSPRIVAVIHPMG